MDTPIDRKYNAQNLKEVLPLLDGLDYFIFYGTLLGLVREGDILEKDDDIDIMVDLKHFEELIDRFDKPYDAKWEIHDYKTGKRSKTSSQAQNDFQLALYQLGVRQNFKDVGEISLVWHSLRHNTNITIFHTDKQLYRLEKKIVKILKSIEKDSSNLKNFKPRKDYQKSTLCNWCPVWDECTAKVGSNPSLKNLIKIKK